MMLIMFAVILSEFWPIFSVFVDKACVFVLMSSFPVEIASELASILSEISPISSLCI